MRYSRWLLMSLIAVLCFGLMSSVLAQDTTEKNTPVEEVVYRLVEFIVKFDRWFDQESTAQAQRQPVIGNRIRGQRLYEGKRRTELHKRLGCFSCHQGGVQAPDTDEIWDLAVNKRLTLLQFENYTPEKYIIESILRPDAYIVFGYSAGLMPQNFGEVMSAQDLADIVAYLRSLSTDDTNN